VLEELWIEVSLHIVHHGGCEDVVHQARGLEALLHEAEDILAGVFDHLLGGLHAEVVDVLPVKGTDQVHAQRVPGMVFGVGGKHAHKAYELIGLALGELFDAVQIDAIHNIIGDLLRELLKGVRTQRREMGHEKATGCAEGIRARI
jgi:hypothetical protein